MTGLGCSEVSQTHTKLEVPFGNSPLGVDGVGSGSAGHKDGSREAGAQ